MFLALQQNLIACREKLLLMAMLSVFNFNSSKQYLYLSFYLGGSAAQEQTTEDATQSSAITVDEEAELKELEFRARALESLVRARERQMKNEQD